MPKTPIPKRLIHDPKEVARNAKLFDAVANLVPSWSKKTKEHIASYWIETVRQNITDEIPLRLDQNMLPAGVKLYELLSEKVLKRFTKVLAKKVNREIDAIILPFDLVLRKDSEGYFVARLYY